MGFKTLLDLKLSNSATSAMLAYFQKADVFKLNVYAHLSPSNTI